MPSATGDSDPSLLDADTVVQLMRSDPERGLPADEVARRLADSGPNELEPDEPVPTWRKILEQFRDPLTYLLFAATAISVAAWLIEGAEGLPFDALVIAAIVVASSPGRTWAVPSTSARVARRSVGRVPTGGLLGGAALGGAALGGAALGGAAWR